MSRPAIVAYINHVEQVGGAERSLLDLLEAVDRTRFTPVAITPGGGELSAELARIEVETRPCPDLSRLHRPRSLLRLVSDLRRFTRGGRGLSRLLAEVAPRIVHANSTTAALFCAWSGGARRPAPLVWHVRDLVPLGPLGKWAARRCAHIVVPSRAVCELARKWAGDDKIASIHNGVATARFVRASERFTRPDDLGGASDPLCVSIGQLVSWKGYSRLLAAAAIVRDRLPRARFVVLGEDLSSEGRGSTQAWRERARAADLGDTVLFLGHRDDVRPYLAAADMLVHAAFPEPFGRVVVEAMSAGLPVVCLAGDHGPSELVRDHVDGLLVQTPTAAALADGICELAGLPAERRHRMGRDAAARAVELFDREVMAMRCCELYEQLLARQGAGDAR